MVRIKDIADRALVSTTTVSNVIHGNTKKVSPDMVRKIEKLLLEMNYVPSMGARMLAGNRSKIIGVLFGGAGRENYIRLSDPFVGGILGAIESAIFSKGYYMMFHVSNDSEENCNLISAWNVDGLLTIGISVEDNLRISRITKVPMVSIDVYYEEDHIPNIGLDDFGGGYEMTKYLISMGHRNILFLADNDVGVDRLRWLGVHKALREANITELGERQVVFSNKKEERMENHRENLALYKKNTALFFASDYYAAEAVQLFQRIGILIPDEISIAGFDDNAYAVMSYPNLTTVHQSVQKKGIQAVDMLLQLIKGETVKKRDRKLPVKLVIRDSVKKLENCFEEQ